MAVCLGHAWLIQWSLLTARITWCSAGDPTRWVTNKTSTFTLIPPLWPFNAKLYFIYLFWCCGHTQLCSRLNSRLCAEGQPHKRQMLYPLYHCCSPRMQHFIDYNSCDPLNSQEFKKCKRREALPLVSSIWRVLCLPAVGNAFVIC